MDSFETKFTTFLEILKTKSPLLVAPPMVEAIKVSMIEAQLNQEGGAVSRKRRVNGYNLFMKDRMKQMKESDPTGDSNRRMTLISAEWKVLSDELKGEWKQKASDLPQEPIHLKVKKSATKKPHQLSGYQLFVREKMSEIKETVPPKERMGQIAGQWKTYNQEQKDAYNIRASQIPPMIKS